jgi:hypothetical protein
MDIQNETLEREPWHDAAEEVHYQWHRFSTSTDELNRAHALLELSNAMGDLTSFLPGYDADSGTLPWEREDWEERS